MMDASTAGILCVLMLMFGIAGGYAWGYWSERKEAEYYFNLYNDYRPRAEVAELPKQGATDGELITEFVQRAR